MNDQYLEATIDRAMMRCPCCRVSAVVRHGFVEYVHESFGSTAFDLLCPRCWRGLPKAKRARYDRIVA